jgi:YfiH family protein
MRECEVPAAEGKARLAFLVCAPMEKAGFVNAFSTRTGGVSPLPANALNLGYSRGDSSDNVGENRRRFLTAIGGDRMTLVTARQTHSSDRATIESLEQAREQEPNCDAMLTRLPEVLLGVQTADCLPILIADPVTGMMAAVHAGWRGTAGRITERTVADLMMLHGVNPRNCIAALGPNACGQCYEVGQDVIDRYKKEFGYWKKLLSNFTDDGKARLDVRAANVQQLAFCGITEDRVYIADYCTMHDDGIFFSYRREAGGKPSSVGRLLAVIGRRDQGGRRNRDRRRLRALWAQNNPGGGERSAPSCS